MGRKKKPENQALDEALARQRRSQAFNLMLGFEEVIEGFSEEEQAEFTEGVGQISQQVKDHRKELLVEALKEQQELAMLENEYQVARAQFLQNFPNFEERLRTIEQTAEKKRNAGLVKASKTVDLGQFL